MEKVQGRVISSILTAQPQCLWLSIDSLDASLAKQLLELLIAHDLVGNASSVRLHLPWIGTAPISAHLPLVVCILKVALFDVRPELLYHTMSWELQSRKRCAMFLVSAQLQRIL
jgi:hypothetical protein